MKFDKPNCYCKLCEREAGVVTEWPTLTSAALIVLFISRGALLGFIFVMPIISAIRYFGSRNTCGICRSSNLLLVEQ